MKSRGASNGSRQRSVVGIQHCRSNLRSKSGAAGQSATSRSRSELEAPAEELWGLATSIDIYDCNPRKIRNADCIRSFTHKLCDLIEMRRFGETQVVHFGEDERVAGYSMVQLIETSLISAHFANLTNAVYLDVFSCKMYDPKTVAEFARKYFEGARCITHTTPRH